MSDLSENEKEYVLSEVRNELDRMSRARYRQIRASESSFVAWIRNIARTIGEIISAPFRAIFAFIEGFIDGLLGWLE